MKKFVLLNILFVCSSLIGYALIINVPTDQSTIQAGINAASNGDTVLVAKGNYNETINFNGKNIVVASHFLTTQDSFCIDETIIQAPVGSCVVIIENGETPEARLVGFTLTGGTGNLVGGIPHGGGLYCNNASPTLESLRIKENVASGMTGGVGGGIYFENSTSLVTGCWITNNESNYGGGIRCNGADITLQNSFIQDNFAVQAAGGVMFLSCPAPRIEGCVFTGNSSIYGGAIANNNSNLVINKTTFFHNSGLYGGSVNMEGMANTAIINSILWQNAQQSGTINEIYFSFGNCSLIATCSDILGGEAGITGTGNINWLDGNMDIYPEFSDTTIMDLSLPETSPCIDAGTALFIYQGDTVVHITDFYGSAPDIGAYEYYTTVAIDPGIEPINSLDFQILSSFTNSKTIRFETGFSEKVTLSVFDIMGRCVDVITEGVLPAGEHSFGWDYVLYQDGIYIVRLTVGNNARAKKMLVQ